MKRLLSVDDITGLETWHEHDPITDVTTIAYTSDAGPILELNKILANDPEYSKAGMNADFWHYAHFPAGVIMDWLINRGVDVYNKEHTKKVLQLLNDPEYRYLKTTSLHHGVK